MAQSFNALANLSPSMPSGFEYISHTIPETVVKVRIFLNYSRHSPVITAASRRCTKAVSARYVSLHESEKVTSYDSIPDKTQDNKKVGLVVRFETDYNKEQSKATVLLDLSLSEDEQEQITVERVMKKDGIPQSVNNVPESTAFLPRSIRNFLHDDCGLKELVRSISVCIQCFDHGCITCLNLRPMQSFISSPDFSAILFELPTTAGDLSLDASESLATAFGFPIAVDDTPASSVIFTSAFTPKNDTTTAPNIAPTATPNPTTSFLPAPHPMTLPMDFFSTNGASRQLFCVLCSGAGCDLCSESPELSAPDGSIWSEFYNTPPPNSGPNLLCVSCGGNGTCALCAGGILRPHERGNLFC